MTDARRRASEKLLALGLSFLPDGWTYTYVENWEGSCFWERMHIEAPKPVTRRRLHIWLHECAHAHDVGRGEPPYRAEMLCEQWAFDRMRETGVPAPLVSIDRAKRYVAHLIDKSKRRGAKRIDAEAIAWSRRDEIRAKIRKRARRSKEHPLIVLSPERVAEIRIRRASGESLNSLAGKFSVHYSTISKICLRRTWAWL
jgi:hypothetical protein